MRSENPVIDPPILTADELIFIGGQSNAMVFGNTGSFSYEPTARVQIWDDQNQDGVGDGFRIMVPGVNTGTLNNPNVWGPEAELATRWLADHAEGTLFIVKVAKGSTGLAENASAVDWSPQSNGEMYDAATSAVASAKAATGLELSAVFFAQGESDAYDFGVAGSYGANLVNLVDHMRADWSADEIVIARVSDTTPFHGAVSAGQQAADSGDDRLISFGTDDYELQADGLHYAPGAVVGLGDDFYDGWMAFQ